MRKHKFALAVVALVFAVTTYGDWAPWVPQNWSGSIGGIVVLSPVALFFWALCRFTRWHRVWHFWLINEAMKPGRRSSGG